MIVSMLLDHFHSHLEGCHLMTLGCKGIKKMQKIYFKILISIFVFFMNIMEILFKPLLRPKSISTNNVDRGVYVEKLAAAFTRTCHSWTRSERSR